jgi:hypothetical protein
MDLEDVVIALEESVTSLEKTPSVGPETRTDPTEQAVVETVGDPVAKPVRLVVSIDDDEAKEFEAEIFNPVAEAIDMGTENAEQAITVAENNFEATGEETSDTTPNDDLSNETTSPNISTKIQPHWKEAVVSVKLLNLPIDALHCIASFVTASDWASFGLTNTVATPICRDVFQRVRMHGFRCATEVATAWVSRGCENLSIRA